MEEIWRAYTHADDPTKVGIKYHKLNYANHNSMNVCQLMVSSPKFEVQLISQLP